MIFLTKHWPCWLYLAIFSQDVYSLYLEPSTGEPHRYCCVNTHDNVIDIRVCRMINGSYGGWYPDDRNNGAGAPDTDWATGGNRQYRHRLIIIYYSRVRICMQYNIQMNCGLWINDTSNTKVGRYPIWFNSMFEFCQTMVHSIFDSILLYPRFNSKYYSIQRKLCWFNSKDNSIQ